MISVAVRP